MYNTSLSLPIGFFAQKLYNDADDDDDDDMAKKDRSCAGIPVRTTMDNSTTVQYAGLLHTLSAQARNCVRDIDPQNELTFLRVRSKKNEIMVAPGDTVVFAIFLIL